MSGAVKGFLSTVRGSELCESSDGELKVDIRHVKYKDVVHYDFVPKIWKKRRKKKKEEAAKPKLNGVVRLGPRPTIPLQKPVDTPPLPSLDNASVGASRSRSSSLPENTKGAVNPVPLNHVNGPIRGPPRPRTESSENRNSTKDSKSSSAPTPPAKPIRSKRKNSPSDPLPSKRPRLANIPRPQSVFDLDIDAAKMLEWLTAVAKWSNYDWSSIVTEFEAMVQAFVHHLSSKMDNQECYRKVFTRFGWRNWKFSRPLKQKTFETMAAEVETLMKSLNSRTLF